MPKQRPPAAERVTASRRIYDGRVVNLREDTVELADGRTAMREVVVHGEVVAIVPLDGDGSVLLVRQYRLPPQAALLELPAGGVDDDETVEEAAQRELREETGYRAERLQRIGGFFVSPGYCTEFIHVFLATGLSESPLQSDPDEAIMVERMSLNQAVALIDSGEIKDGKSIVGLLQVLRRRSSR